MGDTNWAHLVKLLHEDGFCVVPGVSEQSPLWLELRKCINAFPFAWRALTPVHGGLALAPFREAALDDIVSLVVNADAISALENLGLRDLRVRTFWCLDSVTRPPPSILGSGLAGRRAVRCDLLSAWL